MPTRQSPLRLTGAPLSAANVESVARAGASVQTTPAALAAIRRGRRALESVLSDGEPHYGINTGFGSFSRQRISTADLRDLQRNLVRSHAAGVGTPLPDDVVRATMLLLAASLSRGLSGVRPVVVDSVLALINSGITPVVPEIGSVGASGDLAPLAHIALVLIGEGQAQVARLSEPGGRGRRVISGAQALKVAKLKPLTLEAKEGLALINGTHLMAAQGALLVQDFQRLFDAALTAAAMSIDACRATDAFLDPRVHQSRRQPGQIHVAARLTELLKGSKIIPSHTLNDPRVQDPYSLRCAPQVLGAAWDAFVYARGVIEHELGAMTDNPLVFGSGEVAKWQSGKELKTSAHSATSPHRHSATSVVISAGNFHGMPLAIALDTLAIAISHVAGIAERRVYHMLSGFDPETGLPPYLSPKPGLHSGLMIAQYTAAACCNEIIGLATPASVANLSTSAGMEDYNSFGPRSAAKARRALELARNVIAIELICAGEAVEHHRPLRSSPRVETSLANLRRLVPKLTADRPPAPDIAAVAQAISDQGI